MVSTKECLNYLNELLLPTSFRDYCPNGLQVEGKSNITKLACGVSASLDVIEAAIAANADALLVHHGVFWNKDNPSLVGMKLKRIKKLIENDLNLIAYHLPLDAHIDFGNNFQLGHALGLNNIQGLDGSIGQALCVKGHFDEAVDVNTLSVQLKKLLQREPLVIESGTKAIQTVAWCTGAGQSFLPLAIEAGVDAFISGEVSETTFHYAKESGVHYFAAGHHATERFGVQALSAHLAQKFGIQTEFFDSPNPV